MKYLTVISDNSTSYFSEKTAVYSLISHEYYGSTPVRFIAKKDFLDTVSRLLDVYLENHSEMKKGKITSTRFKEIAFKGIVVQLNIKFEEQFVIYSLIELYNLVQESSETNIKIIWGETD